MGCLIDNMCNWLFCKFVHNKLNIFLCKIAKYLVFIFVEKMTGKSKCKWEMIVDIACISLNLNLEKRNSNRE